MSQMNPATSAAAAGDGSPWNQRLSTTPVLTLKRASRSAAQAQYTKAAIQPQRPRPLSDHSYAMSAGAAPKDTMSDNESICSPNALCVLVMRATRPSRLSSTAAMKMP